MLEQDRRQARRDPLKPPAFQERDFMQRAGSGGAATPGDSGSGSNTLLGDAIGDQREAAGINTHIYLGALFDGFFGILAGTRVTQVQGTMANGQLLPYPAPTPLP